EPDEREHEQAEPGRRHANGQEAGRDRHADGRQALDVEQEERPEPEGDHPDTQLALGEAVATLDELKILALHDLSKLEALAAAGRIPTEDELNLYRYRAQVVGERATNAAKLLFELSGGGGLYESEHPIGRIYRNLIAARNHPAAAVFRDSARAIGASMFGKSMEKRLRF